MHTQTHTQTIYLNSCQQIHTTTWLRVYQIIAKDAFLRKSYIYTHTRAYLYKSKRMYAHNPVQFISYTVLKKKYFDVEDPTELFFNVVFIHFNFPLRLLLTVGRSRDLHFY